MKKKEKKRFLLVVFWFTLLCNNLNGQITIEGTISDKSKAPLFGINVTLVIKNQNTIVDYSLSDENGRYKLTCKSDADSLQITLTSFDYEKTFRVVPAKSQTVDFELKATPISLTEVKVKATPIAQYGDTISYLVSDFSSESDRVIGDVLKKLPGIEVSEDGKISYQGKSINKFYIENMDLLQGRYGIATKNISAKDIATVEVFENHQPIKALAETSYSDQAAINLKLREDAKGVISLMSQLGIGGSPFLWDNELISLFFSKKLQNINTYKGNNSGNDIIREFTAFYSDSEPLLYEGRFLSVLAPNPPSINKQRYLFNNTHAVSSSVLHALKNDVQLIANVVYYNDIQKKESYSRSSYYLSSDSSLVLEESLNSKTRTNHVESTLKWEANKEKFFWNNVLNLNGSWIDNTGNARTVDTIRQNLKTDVLNASNKFELIKNFSGQKSIRFYSFNGYAQTPQDLLIKPALYADIVNNGQAFEALHQQTTFKDFSSKTHLSFIIRNHRFIQNYWGGFDASVQSLNTTLQPLQDNGSSANFLLPDSLYNDLLWQKYKAYIQCSYTYTWKGLRVNTSLPLSYNILAINDKILVDKKPIQRILFNPIVDITYEFANNWSIKSHYGFYNYLGNIQNSYTGYIMRNYRSFNRNDGQLAENKSRSILLRMNYRSTKRMLFAHIDMFHEQYTSNLLREQIYIGTLQIQNSIRQSIASNTYGLRGSISKSIHSLRTTVSLSGNYHNTASSQMIQGELVDFRYIYYGFKPRIEAQILSWTTLSYTLQWNENKNIIKKFDNPWIRSIYNNIKLYLYPIEHLEIIAVYENYYNNTVSEGKNKSFFDLGISYRFKWMDFSLTWSNILNTHQYNTASYVDFNEFINVYEIRPSEILLKIKFKII
ncbi:MAG: carboxypeptidase-like regulatory domain-containing protein [Lentimicrobiaceae bacterium]|jgi:hypothetical protein|nr:carboxypeptidase-like regulatory domain-containing protein [Lentimicrobiaceae bacterium]